MELQFTTERCKSKALANIGTSISFPFLRSGYYPIIPKRITNGNSGKIYNLTFYIQEIRIKKGWVSHILTSGVKNGEFLFFCVSFRNFKSLFVVRGWSRKKQLTAVFIWPIKKTNIYSCDNINSYMFWTVCRFHFNLILVPNQSITS